MSETTASDPVAPSKGADASGQVKGRSLLLDIERSKGLGILLVVYGHLVMFGTYGEQWWYADSKNAIYLFHMPFFVYLSGFVFTYVDTALRARKAYGTYVARRADRLLVPFLVSAILIVTGKYLAEQVTQVDQEVTGYFSGYVSLFFDVENSPALSIWYVFVLFAFSAIMPPLLWLFRGRYLPILALALIAYFTPVTSDFYLFRIFHYFIFFVIGAFIAAHRDTILPVFGRLFIPAAIVFAISLFVVDRNWYPGLLIGGILAIPALHGLMRLPMWENDRFFLFFGRNSMVIYLFNTIFIGIAKPIYAKFLPYDGPYFVLFVVVLFLCGVFLPILVRWVVSLFDKRNMILKYMS